MNGTPKTTDPRVVELLDPEELALYQGTTKPGKLCGTMLSALTSRAGLAIEHEILINQMLGQVAANVSQVARIKLQAMPFGERFCVCERSPTCMMLFLTNKDAAARVRQD